MKLLLTTMHLGLAAAAAAAGLRHQMKDPQTYTEANVTWTGTVAPDLPPVTLTGNTLQDIEKQIAAQHPGFTFASNAANAASSASISAAEKDPIGPLDIVCEPPLPKFISRTALTRDLRDGAAFLHNAQGVCIGNPMRGSCSRLYCGASTGAIWLCNDNPTDNLPVEVPCATVGDRVQNIVDGCSWDSDTTDEKTDGVYLLWNEFSVFVGSSAGGC